MTADAASFFSQYKEGQTATNAVWGGASFTRLSGNNASFTAADGAVSYLNSTESIVDIAKRDPKLRAIWEAQYGIKLPSFAVGANLIPHDMLAQLHQGEAVVPAAYNPANGGAMGGNTARLEALVEALTKEVADLRIEARATAVNTRRVADMTDTATEGGRAMKTEVYV
jgi:hypothetical protein